MKPLDLTAAEQRIRTLARRLEGEAVVEHRARPAAAPALVAASRMDLVSMHTTAASMLDYALHRYVSVRPSTGASIDALIKDLLVARAAVQMVDEEEARLDREDEQQTGAPRAH